MDRSVLQGEKCTPYASQKILLQQYDTEFLHSDI